MCVLLGAELHVMMLYFDVLSTTCNLYNSRHDVGPPVTLRDQHHMSEVLNKHVDDDIVYICDTIWENPPHVAHYRAIF